jgi:hypothetical protein
MRGWGWGLLALGWIACGDDGGPEVDGRPVIVSFEADPASVAPGGTSELSYEVTGADTVRIVDGLGQVLVDGTDGSGTVVVGPLMAARGFTLTAVNGDGERSATIDVTVVAPGEPLITTFAAQPETIVRGDFSTLSWTSVNVVSVEIEDVTAGQVVLTGGGPADAQQVTPEATTVYRIVGTSAEGTSDDETVQVAVVEPILVDSFTVTPDTVNLGESAELAWSTTNADDVIITAEGTIVLNDGPPTGTVAVTPTMTTTYTLRARAQGRPDGVAMVTLTVP